MKIAYFGRPGSNTEVAALSYFRTPEIMIPCKFPVDVFSAVGSGVDYGVLPIENSTEGPVTAHIDLLFAIPMAKVVGEHILKIEHLLLVPPSLAHHSILRVFSHQQALAQSRSELDKMGVEQIAFNDTAASAEKVARDKIPGNAALANRRAAELYGLKILREDMANNALNYTRFIIISNKATISPEANKSSITFRLPQGPGKLEHALHCFSRNSIELLSILSRPIPDQRKPEDVWKHYFYIECDGSSRQRNLQGALHMLRRHAIDVRIHGSYVKAKMPR
jgi:prephenate dehydratase